MHCLILSEHVLEGCREGIEPNVFDGERGLTLATYAIDKLEYLKSLIGDLQIPRR